MAKINAKAVLGDKGYDSDGFVGSLEAREIAAVIPPKENRKNKRACDFALYRERNLVERFFNIIKQFRAKHNPDKLTAIFLTDGDGHALRISNAVNLNPIRTLSEKDIGFGRQYASFKLNGRQIRALTWGHAANGEQQMTPTLIENLRITTGAEIIGFYLCDNKNRLRNHAVSALGYTKHGKNALNAWNTIFEKQYSENDVVCIPGAYHYSNYFILAGSDLEIEDEELDVTPDMSRSRIARAFKNFSTNKKGNRIFVTKFAEAIS